MTRFWHGGAAGRTVGDAILPPSITGFSRTSAEINGVGAANLGAYDDAYVYVTTDRNFAEMWAALYTQDPRRPGEGALYRVAVDEEQIWPDEDFIHLNPLVSYKCRVAHVLSPGLRIVQKRSRHQPVIDRYQSPGATATPT